MRRVVAFSIVILAWVVACAAAYAAPPAGYPSSVTVNISNTGPGWQGIGEGSYTVAWNEATGAYDDGSVMYVWQNGDNWEISPYGDGYQYIDFPWDGSGSVLNWDAGGADYEQGAPSDGNPGSVSVSSGGGSGGAGGGDSSADLAFSDADAVLSGDDVAFALKVFGRTAFVSLAVVALAFFFGRKLLSLGKRAV